MGDSMKEIQESHEEISLTRGIIYRVIYALILVTALGFFISVMSLILGQIIQGKV